MSSNGYDDRLTLARQAAAELEQMQRSAAELPELERAEGERLRRQTAQQMEQRASDELQPAAKEYRLSLEKSNLEIIELVRFVSDIVRRRQAIDARGREVARLAGQVAQARIELGQAPGGGSWGTSHNGNLEMLQAVTQQVLAEFKVKPGKIRLDELDEESELTESVIDFLGRFCDVQPDTRPRTLLTGRVLLVGHNGESYWG